MHVPIPFTKIIHDISKFPYRHFCRHLFYKRNEIRSNVWISIKLGPMHLYMCLSSRAVMGKHFVSRYSTLSYLRVTILYPSAQLCCLYITHVWTFCIWVLALPGTASTWSLVIQQSSGYHVGLQIQGSCVWSPSHHHNISSLWEGAINRGRRYDDVHFTCNVWDILLEACPK